VDEVGELRGQHVRTGVVAMRTVKIVEQPDRSHPHAAVNTETGSVVLKHQDDYALIGLCRRLGWTVELEETRNNYSGRNGPVSS